MQTNFDACLEVILRAEGGFVDDPHDPGGATNRGVTIATLSAYFGRPATLAEVRDLTRDTAARIYETDYWRPAGCDTLPAGLDLVVFDAAVNCGDARALAFLKRAGGGDTAARIRSYQAASLTFHKSLATWSRYGHGWSARLASTQARALLMASTARPVATVAAPSVRIAPKAGLQPPAGLVGTILNRVFHPTPAGLDIGH